MLSTIRFSLDQSKILLSGKGLSFISLLNIFVIQFCHLVKTKPLNTEKNISKPGIQISNSTVESLVHYGLSYQAPNAAKETRAATRCDLTHYQPQILDSSKLKEFADNNFKFDENGRKLSKRVENTVGKGEIARYEQFLLFPQCFQKACFPGASKGVIVWESVNTPRQHFDRH